MLLQQPNPQPTPLPEHSPFYAGGLPGGWVFTCLSYALVMGASLRAQLTGKNQLLDFYKCFFKKGNAPLKALAGTSYKVKTQPLAYPLPTPQHKKGYALVSLPLAYPLWG